MKKYVLELGIEELQFISDLLTIQEERLLTRLETKIDVEENNFMRLNINREIKNQIITILNEEELKKNGKGKGKGSKKKSLGISLGEEKKEETSKGKYTIDEFLGEEGATLEDSIDLLEEEDMLEIMEEGFESYANAFVTEVEMFFECEIDREPSVKRIVSVLEERAKALGLDDCDDCGECCKGCVNDCPCRCDGNCNICDKVVEDEEECENVEEECIKNIAEVFNDDFVKIFVDENDGERLSKIVSMTGFCDLEDTIIDTDRKAYEDGEQLKAIMGSILADLLEKECVGNVTWDGNIHDFNNYIIQLERILTDTLETEIGVGTICYLSQNLDSSGEECDFLGMTGVVLMMDEEEGQILLDTELGTCCCQAEELTMI